MPLPAHLQMCQLLLMKAGLPELEAKVVEAVQSHQKGSTAVDFAVAAAKVLEAVILGSSIADAVAQVAEMGPAITHRATRDVMAHNRAEVEDVIQVCASALAISERRWKSYGLDHAMSSHQGCALICCQLFMSALRHCCM
jgi:hypothetical protein